MAVLASAREDELIITYKQLDDGDWACTLEEIETTGTGRTRKQAGQEAKELMISLAEAITDDILDVTHIGDIMDKDTV